MLQHSALGKAEQQREVRLGMEETLVRKGYSGRQQLLLFLPPAKAAYSITQLMQSPNLVSFSRKRSTSFNRKTSLSFIGVCQPAWSTPRAWPRRNAPMTNSTSHCGYPGGDFRGQAKRGLCTLQQLWKAGVRARGTHQLRSATLILGRGRRWFIAEYGPIQ